jgi:hypothetical protein
MKNLLIIYMLFCGLASLCMDEGDLWRGYTEKINGEVGLRELGLLCVITRKGLTGDRTSLDSLDEYYWLHALLRSIHCRQSQFC